MIDRRIAKFKLRRGTDAQRLTVVFDEGELVYVTDTQRVYVGTGEPTLSGGKAVAQAVFYTENQPPAIHSPGDLHYQEDIGKFFIYNNDNFATFVGPYGDDTSITFDGNSKFTIASGGVKAQHLDATVAKVSGGVGVGTSGLYINYDPSTLRIDGSNRLTTVPNNTVSAAVDPAGGIVRNPLGYALNADTKTVIISSNIVRVGTISANNIATSAVEITKLHTNVVQPSGGLKISLSGLAANPDNNTIKLSAGKLAVDLGVISSIIPSVSIPPGVPAGTIIYTACAAAPAGYLACDGTKVSLATYPGLSAIYVGDPLNNNSNSITFGKKYIAPTESTPNATGTYISLPDLRGVFTRGHNNQSSGYDASRAFGSVQVEELKSHTHTVIDPGHTHPFYWGQSAGTPLTTSGNSVKQYSYHGIGGPHIGSATTGISIQNAGGTETRPVNLALLACIKT
jgi:hypothetical protein